MTPPSARSRIRLAGLAVLPALTIMLPGACLAAESSSGAAVASLGALVPAHHALHGFSGPLGWYGHRPPPEVGYEQPDFEAWAEGLEEEAVDPPADSFVAVWRDAAGAIRHVLVKNGHVRLFSIEGDTVEFEDPGFMTQVGVARWGWVYGDGLLRTHRTWRMALGPPDESGAPTGPPAPTALYSVTDYDYGKGKKVPARSRTFWSEEDRRVGRWGQKTTYDANGRHKKTRHNPERPYPH